MKWFLDWKVLWKSQGFIGENFGIYYIYSLKGDDNMHNVAYGFPRCASGKGHGYGL
jgi:hypothetical protein